MPTPSWQRYQDLFDKDFNEAVFFFLNLTKNKDRTFEMNEKMEIHY